MHLPNIFKDTPPAKFSAGSIIFDVGQKGEEMYIVQEGAVDIMIGETVIETVEPSGFFGEMALLDSTPRAAKAVAKTDCALTPISQRQFLFMLDETPFFAIQVMKEMARRLRRSPPSQQ